jgi:hypothetical protein
MDAPAVRRRTRARRWLGAALALGLAMGLAAPAQAQTGYGLTTTNELVSFSLTTPGTVNTNVAVTGITIGQRLVGLDFRPTTGELFALGYNGLLATANAQLYTINRSTGVATAVSAPITLALGGITESVGFDFNPTNDRIRVVSTNNANYRLHPDTGAVVIRDPDVTYFQSVDEPSVGAVAYTNSFIGSTSTQLYAVDIALNQIGIQNATTGIIDNRSLVGLVQPNANNALPGVESTDLDIYFNLPAFQQTAYLMNTATTLGPPAATTTSIYSLNLGTPGRNSTLIGTLPAGVNLTEFAVLIDRAIQPLSGTLLYSVTFNNTLISYDSNNPSFIRSLVPITGIQSGQTLVGTDFRPNTGQLFGLGYDENETVNNARLYTINLATGLATPVAAAMSLNLGGNTNEIGFDFNPTVDRIRVTGGSTRFNYRINPVTGAVTTDGFLSYGSLPQPNIGSVAYTNSYIGSTSTALYDIDGNRNVLALQNPPNNGTLTVISSSPLFATPGSINDLDIYFDAATRTNWAFAVSNADPNTAFANYSSLYDLNLSTGQAALVGPIGVIGGGLAVRDVAAFYAPPVAPPLSGQLVYAIAGGSLVTFDSALPGVIRSAVGLSGVDATQTLVGLDFRPATSELYGLGYNASNGTARLYTINLTTAVATPVGAANIALALGNANDRIGFDFNPTVDRIRVVSTNEANYRLNPNDGSITATDGTLNPGAGPGLNVSGAAYTNSSSNIVATALYDYDATTGNLYTQNPPNAGTLVLVGSSGLAASTEGADFDIFNTRGTTTNVGYLAVAPAGTSFDNLYTLSLTTGAPTLVGLIGTGSNLSGMAVFIQPSTQLTWNGSVSTDWGTAANWTPNRVPDSSDDVLIPGGTPREPSVSNAQEARIVTINAGATVTTANGGNLSISGNIVNNGTITGAGSGVVVLNSSTAQTIGGTGTTRFQNLSIGAAGASLSGGPVAIQRVLTLTGNLTTAGRSFTLLSNNTDGTAMVVNNPGTVVGSTIVQRAIDPSRNPGVGYRHYSSPVANSTVGDLSTTGFTPVVNPAYNTVGGTVTPFPNVFGYNEQRVNTSGNPGTQDFDRGYFSPASLGDALQPTRGYTVNISAAATVDFEGTLNNGNLAASGLSRGNLAQSGWHLLGNPYPAPINWDSVTSNGLSNVNPALYVFKSSGQYTGSYASYINGVGTNGGSNVLPLGQGFFVRVSAPGATGNVAFENADRLNSFNATPFQRGGNDARPRLTLNLSNANSATQTAIYFQAGATAAAEARYDAEPLANPNGLTLVSEAAGRPLAINGLPLLTGTDVLVPLQLKAATAGTYALNADELVNLPAGYHAYLRDAVTGSYTDLATMPSVPVTLAANTALAGRYALLFTTQTRVLATAPAELAQLVNVYPNPAHGTATLLLTARCPTTVGQRAVCVAARNELSIAGSLLPAVQSRLFQQRLTMDNQQLTA